MIRQAIICWILLLPALGWGQADTARARALADEAQLMEKERNFSRAIALRKASIDLYQQAVPPDQAAVVRGWTSVGRYYRKADAFDSCLVYLQLAISTGERYLDSGDEMLLEAYNSRGIYHYYLGEWSEALTFYEKALRGWTNRLGPDNLKAADLYNNMAICYDQLGDYSRSLEFYEKALDIRWKLLGDCDPVVGESLLNLGITHHNLGDLDRALDLYSHAGDIWEQTLEPGNPDFSMLYNNMGVCYQNKGDYSRAQSFLEKALHQAISAYGNDHTEVANACNNLGLNFIQTGDYDRALVYFQKALQLRRENLGSDHHLVASIFNNMANCLRLQKKYDQALHYFQEALRIRLARFGSRHREVADSYNDLGRYFEDLQDYPSALEQYRQALPINLDQLGAYHPAVADTYERMAYCLQGSEARRYFHRAIAIRQRALGAGHPDVATLYAGLAASFSDQPDSALYWSKWALAALGLEYAGRANQLELAAPLSALQVLLTRGNILLERYQVTRSEKWLLEAENTYQKARNVIERARRTYQEPVSKQILYDRYYQIFEKSLLVEYLLYQNTCDPLHLQTAFSICENSRNVLFFESVQKLRAERFSGVPDSLFQREKDLLIDLAFYDQLRFQEERKGRQADAGRIKAFRDRSFDLKRRYYALVDTLRDRYPDYYQLRYGKPRFDLAMLQAGLGRDQATLIEYFQGENDLFAWVIRPDTAAFFRLSGAEGLPEQMAAFRRHILDSSLPGFLESGPSLYQTLLGPLAPLIRGESLVIAADGDIALVPFECLIEAQPQPGAGWKDLDYLIRKWRISYQFTAIGSPVGDWASGKPPRYGLLAMAPDFSPQPADTSWQGQIYASLPELRHNQDEARELGRFFSGKVLVGEEATEEAFLAEAGNYGVLHLATHARAGDQAFLAFSNQPDSVENELLFVRDLYNMRLSAYLVVLSACETGLGVWQRGEGVASIGRGFFYAGARSLVASLWQVDDEPTARIMGRFYRLLKKGLPKDEALRQAKLEYIESNGDRRARPIFWAAFVPAGDMAPVKMPDWPTEVWIFILALCSGGALLILRLLRKRPA